MKQNGNGSALATVPRKRGRKPASESKCAEHRYRVMEWLLTPEIGRKPATQKELAADLGIAKQTLNYYVQTSPKSMEDFIAVMDQEQTVKNFRAIAETVSRLALKGHSEMAKLWFKQFVEPHRPEEPKKNRMLSDPHLQQAIAELVRPTMVLESKAVVIDAPEIPTRPTEPATA